MFGRVCTARLSFYHTDSVKNTMKLHLPCALRGALLACFAVACTMPAGAAGKWFNADTYEITDGGGANFSISTEEKQSPDYNGYWIRVSPAGEGVDQAAARNATIGTLTLTLADGKDKESYYQCNINGNASGNGNFTGLTINKIDILDTSHDMTLHVHAGNTVYLAGTDPLDSKLKLKVVGTLGLDYDDWCSLDANNRVTGYIGDDANATGNILFGGTINAADYVNATDAERADIFASYDDELAALTTKYSSSAADSAGKLSFAVDETRWDIQQVGGYRSELVWDENTSKMGITMTYLGTGCTTEYVLDDPSMQPPLPADYTATAENSGKFVQVQSDSNKMDGSESAWTMQLHGVIYQPTDWSSDLVLFSTSNQGIGDTFSQTDAKLESGNFAIILNSKGELYLHRSGEYTDKTGSNMVTSFLSYTLPNMDWTSMSFGLTLKLEKSGDYMKLSLVESNAKTYILLYDGEGNALNEVKPGLAWINIGSGIDPAKFATNFYTRINANSYVSISKPAEAPDKGLEGGTPIPTKSTWYLMKNEDGTAANIKYEDLVAGKYQDYDTGENNELEEGDIIEFHGGVLTTEDDAGWVYLTNELKSVNGNAISLAPGADTLLLIEEGQKAVDSKNLTIGGGKDSAVGLVDVGSIGYIGNFDWLSGITLEENATLIFYETRSYYSGPRLQLEDGYQGTSIGTGSSVILDGPGTLIFSGKGTSSASSTSVDSLMCDYGTLSLGKGITANYLSADTLFIQGGADIQVVEDATKSYSGYVLTYGNLSTESSAKLSARDILVGSLFLDEVGAGNLKLAASSSVSATGLIDVADGDVTLAENSKLSADTLSVAGDITADSSSSITTTSRLQAQQLSVGGDSTISIGAGVLSIAGETWLSTTAEIDGDTIDISSTNEVYSRFEDLLVTTQGIQASEAAYAHIEFTAPKTKAAAPVDFSFDLGRAYSSKLEGTGNVEVINTTLTNTPIIVTDGTLHLNGTTHDVNSTVSVSGADATADTALTLTGATFIGATADKGGSITMGSQTYSIRNASSATFTGEGVQNADGNSITLSKVDIVINGDEYRADLIENITILQGQNGEAVDMSRDCVQTLTTAPGMKGELDIVDGKLVITLTDDSESILEEVASSSNASATVGALYDGNARAQGGVLEQLYDHIRDTTGASLEERREVLNQLSSGSITMLADSQRRGVVNTINRLRNRVIQMGNPYDVEPETHIHAWIEADGSYDDIDQDGGSAGYEFQTWGGTVGMHADVGNYSFGAAISAAYGELTAHSEDRAEGNNDTVTLSAFARHQSGKWTQMGILSLGMNEMEMERMVDDYKATGDSSGYTATAYYEAGYTLVLNEDASQVLQPLVSVMLTGASVDGLEETGTIGNAGLCSADESYVYGTVGIGARYQVVLGEDVNARLSFLELRAKLVQDFGDETNEASVHFAGLPGQGFTVQGADVGRTGVQLGAGISVPVGIYKTLFADVDADIRSGATSVSGSVGLRVEF